jgi:hypothetical protein
VKHVLCGTRLQVETKKSRCYTNHALDQFLEHLIKSGVDKVIRVGGQSRSDVLKDHNLRIIAQSEGKTKTESHGVYQAFTSLKENEGEANLTLQQLRGAGKDPDWKHLENHIRQKYPRIHGQFGRIDEEGFETVGRHPFDIWKPEKATIDPPVVASALQLANALKKASQNAYSLNHDERCALVCLWATEVYEDIVAELLETIESSAKLQENLNNIHDETDRRILQDAEVIGVTTSGLAKRISVLRRVRSKVIICEEAGEVMEPHMISALLPTVEHCIQIGDHEQLRPSINNFKELSLESQQGALHQLDRSQFERLSVGQRGRPLMPVAQLGVQRRMRPEISTLVRQTIYPRLEDHISTANLPDVVGLRKNVFWFDHKNYEDNKESDVQHSKSKSNTWEVNMVLALVRHIVRQGTYNSSEIAVLTPYTGQLQKLRLALRSDFEIVLSDRDQEALEDEGFDTTKVPAEKKTTFELQSHTQKPLEKKKLSDLLRVATVDNFQGEEAKVIIVSLVRSNQIGNVGFLKTSNRINVLLSRAQHGMYLIGNTDTYSNVEIWGKVINILRVNDSVGDALDLCCPRHPEKIIEIREPDDFFAYSPEGGCREACADRLGCGHRCQARCHSKTMHEVFQCELPCQRRHKPCDHPCQKATCGESCGVCMISIDNVILPCGHVRDGISCHKTLDLDKVRCDVIVSKQVPNCGHTVNVKCSRDVSPEKFSCFTPCGALLPCGHLCPGTCSSCSKVDNDGNLLHVKCPKICGRKHGTCSHNCPRACHDGADCGPCRERCDVSCLSS